MGMIMLAQGFATFSGIWLAGLLRDAMGDYKWTFYTAGVCVTISGLILFCVKKLPNNTQHDRDDENVEKEQV